MTMSSDATPSATFAARCFIVSRVIHWLTVALVCGLWHVKEGEINDWNIWIGRNHKSSAGFRLNGGAREP